MITQVHKHIIGELGINARTDTIFVITAIFLNLLTLAINSVLAGSRGDMIIMFTFVLLIIVINIVSEIALIRGRQMRAKLLEGLLKMYKDQGVEGYYEVSLMGDYSLRYNLFMLIVLFTGLIAIIIPFIIR